MVIFLAAVVTSFSSFFVWLLLEGNIGYCAIWRVMARYSGFVRCIPHWYASPVVGHDRVSAHKYEVGSKLVRLFYGTSTIHSLATDLPGW